MQQGIDHKMPGFLHVPKTGGTYLGQLESDTVAVINPMISFGHAYFVDQDNELNPVYVKHDPDSARHMALPRKRAETHFVFSTVRNIFAWLVSYAGHAGGWNPKYPSLNHYDQVDAKKGFEHLIKVIASREDQWPSRKFIHCQLFSSGSDLMVDWINRQESLDENLAIMAGHLGLEYKQKPPQRVGGVGDYRRYYTDELIELVAKTWSRELLLFGYDFEGAKTESALITGEISRDQKAGIKYLWKQDRLTISGKELPRKA